MGDDREEALVVVAEVALLLLHTHTHTSSAVDARSSENSRCVQYSVVECAPLWIFASPSLD